MNFPPSKIGKGSMLIIPMKNEIIQSHNKNIEMLKSTFDQSMKFITGLYGIELSLIIPIKPLSGSSGDDITSINDVPINGPADFPILNPGEMASVTVLRDGQALEFGLEVMSSPDDPERGLIGIMRDNSIPYSPVMNFIDWSNVDFNISMFLLWLWMISFFIGIINMLPLPILDGGKFIHTIIDKRISDKSVNVVMWIIYGFTFVLFGLNIALSYIKSGWFTI